jgi:hypothetical protein
LDEVLLGDLARQLGSLVDQISLLGAGPAQNQPTGVGATTGVHQIANSTYGGFMHAERLIGDANVPLAFLGTITSPSGKEFLQTTPVVSGYPVFIWDRLTNPRSSAEVVDNKAYVGAWQMLTIAIWGGLEIEIDPLKLHAKQSVAFDWQSLGRYRGAASERFCRTRTASSAGTIGKKFSRLALLAAGKLSVPPGDSRPRAGFFFIIPSLY